jgi:hypothetical protein
MPRFEYDGNIDIDVNDFLDDCTDSEITEVIEYLIDNDFISKNDVSIANAETKSINDLILDEAISKIMENKIQLTDEEEQLIINLSKRFI